jgi:branched-chain amino acid transport system permease protein
MTIFLQSLLSGVLIGGAYALIGVGLTIIFGVMRIINFAHGDLVMLGMYASYFLFTLGNVDPFVSIVFVFPMLFLFGAILQKTVINKVLNALPQNQILLTIGIGLILSNTMMLLFTSDYRIISTTYSSGSFRLGEISVSTPLLLSFVITGVVTAILYWFLLKTDTGQAIRATAQDRDAAQLMGVNVKRMSVLATGIGAGLAAVAGSLISPTYYIFPQVGQPFTLKAFVIVVLGGMGSVMGATVGGILIGATESLAGAYISSGLKDLVVYVLFLLILLFKPAGLFGKSRV